jgi:hypothetical protein
MIGVFAWNSFLLDKVFAVIEDLSIVRILHHGVWRYVFSSSRKMMRFHRVIMSFIGR